MSHSFSSLSIHDPDILRGWIRIAGEIGHDFREFLSQKFHTPKTQKRVILKIFYPTSLIARFRFPVPTLRCLFWSRTAMCKNRLIRKFQGNLSMFEGLEDIPKTPKAADFVNQKRNRKTVEGRVLPVLRAMRHTTRHTKAACG